MSLLYSRRNIVCMGDWSCNLGRLWNFFNSFYKLLSLLSAAIHKSFNPIYSVNGILIEGRFRSATKSFKFFDRFTGSAMSAMSDFNPWICWHIVIKTIFGIADSVAVNTPIDNSSKTRGTHNPWRRTPFLYLSSFILFCKLRYKILYPIC